jgi:hypothetical protein
VKRFMPRIAPNGQRVFFRGCFFFCEPPLHPRPMPNDGRRLTRPPSIQYARCRFDAARILVSSGPAMCHDPGYFVRFAARARVTE